MKKLFFAVILFAILCGCKKNTNELYVYNWSEYMPESVLKEFEKETGIKVVYSTYDSNEMMYSKVKIQKGAGYDIIFPSTYYVNKMAKEGLLLELDHSKVDFSVFRPDLINQSYDEGNRYSVPYFWGPTIIMFNKKYVEPSSITKWADLWDSEYKGYVLLNNDIREVFQMALMTLGYSGNSIDEKEVYEAYELLQKLVPSVRVFNSDSPRQPFINEEVRIGMTWGGEIQRGMKENSNLDFVYPEEGAILWMDSLVISKNANNIDNAYQFIEFISRPEVAARLAENIGYATPNVKALEIMSDELKNNRLMNPTAEDLKNSEFQTDIGAGIQTYEKYWEKLKTGR